ncbi:MAG: hypothetical protein AAF559_07745 [Pseudomonadota bacterium]
MRRKSQGKAGVIRIAAIAIAAGVIMAPHAPVVAQGKPKSSAASAAKAKPSPTRSKYTKKLTKRKPVRQRTAADVINARAAREHAAHRQTRLQRFTGWVRRAVGRGQTAQNAPAAARPGFIARTTARVTGAFSKLTAKLRRAPRSSVRLNRLVRDANGRLRERPQV